MFPRKLTRPIALASVAAAIAAAAYGIVGAAAGNGSSAATTTTTSAAPPGRPMPGGGAANARSGPAAGGTTGTVASVSGSSFTLSTPAGQKVSVNKTSSTAYRKGTSSLSASAVKKGVRVLVLGTVNGTTITAGQVILLPASGSTPATAVVPFRRGAPSTTKQVGQIPADYQQGSGTIVSGTQANRATEAALAAYPGGIVDRVVKLSDGEYEVHNIGVNWPHHIFVGKNFKVVGAG